MAQLTGCQALRWILGQLLEFLWVDPDGSRRECDLHQRTITGRENNALLLGRYASDPLAN